MISNKSLAALLEKETTSGILLAVSALLALIIANSPLEGWYDRLLDTPVAIKIDKLEIYKPLLLWINDGLMAIFFLLIALEVKREFLRGTLSSMPQIVLPAVGAIGGMVVPAAIYLLFNSGNPNAADGWAIPVATDIAFALGVLALLGSRIPVSIRVFLLALAIFDDLGAIIIIALFYTSDLSTPSLIAGAVFTSILIALNRFGVGRISFYVVVGVCLWVSVLKSGVHATLAGVAIGLMIPLKDDSRPGYSPLEHAEHALKPWVMLGILPLFAFANAGVALQNISLEVITTPVPLGVIGGLFIGKQLGIMLFCGLFIALGWARLPAGATWLQFYGAAVLCGIGFTMSLFIASLAFDHAQAQELITSGRLSILIGSFLSAVVGFIVLRFATATPAARMHHPA